MNKELQQQSEPVIENYINGIIPEPSDENGSCSEEEPEKKERKIEIPDVRNMTKYLFHHHRLTLYSFLNRELRTGRLERTVGFEFSNRVVNKQVCSFEGVTYWRIDRENFLADVDTTLRFETAYGVREWRGYITLWFNAEMPGPMKCTVEGLAAGMDIDRSGMVMLSPFLVPYFTSRQLDIECEFIWEKYIPGASRDRMKRKAENLAKAMGLKVRYYPLAHHKDVKSILFLIDDSIEVEYEQGYGIETEEIPANTIVINTKEVKPAFSDFEIYHECIHFEEHYLFFRLQEMHTNDIQRMEKKVIVVKENEKVTDPVYWMEKQANRGAYGLMMPVGEMEERIASWLREVKEYRHQGDRYEKAGSGIGKDLNLPDFRIRARMIQMGHVHAKGALNYVEHKKIQPFSFEAESLKKEEHTFVIDSLKAWKIYEKNRDFRALMDTGQYIYADGHIVRNVPKYVVRTKKDGMMLTPWASAHVDQCCLRFTRIYERHNSGRYVFGQMNYDADYVKQMIFYLEDIINAEEIDELEAKDEYIKNFPTNFKDAFDKIMNQNHMRRGDMAEALHTTERSLSRWLPDPENMISIDFVVMISLIWRLPDWISDLLLDRAGRRLSEINPRHKALKFILRVMWMDGIDSANEFLEKKGFEVLKVN